MASAQGETPIREIVAFFLRLGISGFGGPAAHIALMEREAVERRGWLKREQFLDLVGGCNLLPGPSSTQVAMALGFTRRRWVGLAIAGTCFILPAALATLALAWAYVRYGHLPQIQGLLYGAKPVMVAIVVQAIWRLGRMALSRWTLALIGAACFAAAMAGAPPIAVILTAGAVELLVVWQRSRKQEAAGIAWLPVGMSGAASAGAGAVAGLVPIAFTFLKLGIVVFGSGYVLLAFLKTDLVDRLHWISEQQLLDAVTAGQVTPGPLFATATFIGYLLHGVSGAAVATIAIFLPSFFMAGAVGAYAGRIRASRPAAALLDGVNAAAVALMAQMALVLGRAALVDGWTWGLGIASALLLLCFRVNATWVILTGGVLGVLLQIMK